MGMYSLLAILWFFLIGREIHLGPEPRTTEGFGDPAPAAD
jgi:hypothetical protein